MGEVMAKYIVIWDNGDDCGTFGCATGDGKPWLFDTEEEAETFWPRVAIRPEIHAPRVPRVGRHCGQRA